MNETEMALKAYDEMMRKNKAFVYQINEQEQHINRLISEKAKEISTKIIYEKKKSAFEMLLQARDEMIAEQRNAIGEYEKQLENERDLITSLEKKLKSLEDKLKQYQLTYEDSIRKHEEYIVARKEASAALRNAEKIAIMRVTEAEQYKLLLELRQQEIENLKEKVRSLSDLENFARGDQYLHEEINRFKVRFK
jgi:DNA repair exonuclease SbcCD ATPase subunit